MPPRCARSARRGRPLASASVVSGHFLSAGISSGEPLGKNSRCIPSGISISPPVCSGVPAGLVHHQKDAPLLARSHLFSELSQCQREQLGVERGHDHPENLPALGPNEAVEVGPLVAPSRSGPWVSPTGAHSLLITGFSPSRASSCAQNSTDLASGWAFLSRSSFIGRLS
jgi:hypothetical protein